MRILVATDWIGVLSSRQAGEVIAASWPPSAEISVLPIGDAGAGFATAYADLAGLTTSTQVTDGVIVTTCQSPGIGLVQALGSPSGVGIPYQESSRPIGEAIAAMVSSEPRPSRILIDLAGLRVHDAGAGLLAALGAVADRPLDQGVDGLNGLSQLDLALARALLADTELVGVVPAAQLGQPLLGLRGITARVGQEANAPPELMLRTDATLETFARLASSTHSATPGAGACGGLGFAVLALGGRLSTGPALALASSQAKTGLRAVDLVVTGCSVFDFASRGGGVVAAMAEAASAALSPGIVIAGEVVIGSREMRTMGIEAAYAVRESVLDDPRGNVSEEELATTAARVARSWTW
ncbi:MAG TPA: glycerate kinase [Propionibacteriaceae bacterium]|nr:glycerate kinase [Propionibacteriaceae bacterium]